MKYNTLGDSDLRVSEICLGTMTYGQQNTRPQAHQQLDYAVERGINFIDTAETYSTPMNPKTQGKTEEYIGEWLVKQQRDRLIIATKVAGYAPQLSWIREGKNHLNRKNIEQAIEASLKRLKTDYIDLYQIHWPDRYVSLFGRANYDIASRGETVPIQEQLEVFADLIKAGKMRYLGLSNETPWGVCEFSHLAKQLGLPKVISIQNSYSLLNRVFEIHLSEACYENNISLLAYSPLAFGHLTGKYLEEIPANSRVGLFPKFDDRYQKTNKIEAVTSYIEIAKKYDLSPTQMALAFVRSRWFVTSTIIGATTIAQLQENIDSLNIELSQEVLTEIDEIQARYPNPTP
ncbi:MULTISPECIES: aldo/keto reductase [Spirulina sp. CCY15215]|uniref:aldo/keto reductase n=1 Tax=Spirulina sp. CCY15215 TaxID=2767591 RepID=UPI001950BCE0|nr:aldo/keto reductase [Spirulina major]